VDKVEMLFFYKSGERKIGTDKVGYPLTVKRQSEMGKGIFVGKLLRKRAARGYENDSVSHF
jgi:hypothetical protein